MGKWGNGKMGKCGSHNPDRAYLTFLLFTFLEVLYRSLARLRTFRDDVFGCHAFDDPIAKNIEMKGSSKWDTADTPGSCSQLPMSLFKSN